MSTSKATVLLELRDEMSSKLKKATKSVQDHQATFRKASMMMAGAAAVFGGALFAATRAEREQQLAVASLSKALDNVGVEYETVREDVEAATAALQRKTNFGDEDQIKALATLVQLTGDYEKSVEVLPAVLDLAAARGMDLSSAATLVGRAVNGETGALTRYGVKLDETADSTAVLTGINEKFGGQAEALADPVIQLGNSFGDLLESLKVRETVLQVAGALFLVSDAVGKLPAPVLKAFGILLTAAFVLFTTGAVVAGIAAMAGALAFLMPVMVGSTAIFSVFGATVAIALGPLTLIVLAVAAVGVAAFLLWKNWDTVWGFIKGAFEKVSSFFSSVFRSKWGWLLPGGPLIKALLFMRDNWDTIWGGMKIVLSGAISFFLTVVGTVIGKLKSVWEAVWGVIGTPVKKAFGGVVALIKGFINTIISAFNVLIRGINKVQVNVPSWVPGVGGKSFGVNIPEITPLAEGGIVKRPTLALLGERGPEAVVPLPAGGGMGTGDVHIHFPAHGLVFLDNPNSMHRLGTIITRLLRDELRGQRLLTNPS
jgi:hypothetical protein